MLTSDDLRLQLLRARKLKLDAYIVKPVRRSELIEAIARAMTTSQLDHPKAVPMRAHTGIILPPHSVFCWPTIPMITVCWSANFLKDPAAGSEVGRS